MVGSAHDPWSSRKVRRSLFGRLLATLSDHFKRNVILFHEFEIWNVFRVLIVFIVYIVFVVFNV